MKAVNLKLIANGKSNTNIRILRMAIKSFSFDVHSYFNISKSWVKEYSPSQKLLLHEQLHFDIAELWARKLKKHLLEAHFSNKEYDDEISLIFSDIIQQCKSMQVQYDKETNHGLKKYSPKGAWHR